MLTWFTQFPLIPFSRFEISFLFPWFAVGSSTHTGSESKGAEF